MNDQVDRRSHDRRATDRGATDRRKDMHEENQRLLIELLADVRSIKERNTDQIFEINKKLDRIFVMMDDAAEVKTNLRLLQQKVEATERSRNFMLKVVWGTLTAVLSLVAERLIRGFHT